MTGSESGTTLVVLQGGEQMRRTIVTFIVVIVSLVATSPAAVAGGAWIRLTQVDGQPVPTGPSGPPAWAPVGAVVTMQGTFCIGQYPPPSTGSWFAYLSLEGRAPMLLSPVEVTAPVAGADCPFVARTTFTVPDVAAGSYTVQVCNLGCHHGVGDLSGGFFTVASTSLEALLLGRLQQTRVKASRLADRFRRAKADTDHLAVARENLDAARTTLAATQAANDRLVAQRNAALKAREAAEAAIPATARNWKIVASLLAFLMAMTWTVVWVRRRSRVRIRVPDTIEELQSVDHHADR